MIRTKSSKWKCCRLCCFITIIASAPPHSTSAHLNITSTRPNDNIVTTRKAEQCRHKHSVVTFKWGKTVNNFYHSGQDIKWSMNLNLFLLLMDRFSCHYHSPRLVIRVTNSVPCNNTMPLTWCRAARTTTTTAPWMRVWSHLMTDCCSNCWSCRRCAVLSSRLSTALCLEKQQQPSEARMWAKELLPQGEPENRAPHDPTPIRVPIPSSHKHNYTSNRPFATITLGYNSSFQLLKKWWKHKKRSQHDKTLKKHLIQR